MSAPLFAANETPGWKSLLEQGETAENSRNSKAAEKLLIEACEIAAQTLESESQQMACDRLAVFHAVEGKLAKAEQVLNELLQRLRKSDSARLFDISQTLLTLAEVQAARSEPEAANQSLREVVQNFGLLNPFHRVRIQVRQSAFHLGGERNMAGMRLLDRAQAQLRAVEDLDSSEYITAAAHLASALRWYGSSADARQLLEPIIARTRARLAENSDIPSDLGEASLLAADEYLLAIARGRDLPPVQDLYDEIDRWKQRILGRPASTVVQVKEGEVSMPRLTKRREPQYNPAARAARVNGVVVLALEVWPDGMPHNIRVVQPLPYGLSWAAVRAVRTWRFRPGTKGGQPVKVRAIVETRFRTGLQRNPSRADSERLVDSSQPMWVALNLLHPLLEPFPSQEPHPSPPTLLSAK